MIKKKKKNWSWRCWFVSNVKFFYCYYYYHYISFVSSSFFPLLFGMEIGKIEVVVTRIIYQSRLVKFFPTTSSLSFQKRNICFGLSINFLFKQFLKRDCFKVLLNSFLDFHLYRDSLHLLQRTIWSSHSRETTSSSRSLLNST